MKKHLRILALTAVIIIFSGISGSYLRAQVVNLSYGYQTDNPVKYTLKSSMVQMMDIQGQAMETTMSSIFGCTVKREGTASASLILEISVDTIAQYMESPMGASGGSAYGVKGKSCQVIIEPSGKVTDLSGAEKLVYTLESGQNNLSETMSDFFPIMPNREVKEGDTWSFSDTITTMSPSSRTTKIENAESKLVGFETVNGIECAKISTTHSGSIRMDMEAQGMEISMQGPYTGTSECLFAIREGYFLKLATHSVVEGNFELPAMGMAFPMTMDTKGECLAR